MRLPDCGCIAGVPQDEAALIAQVACHDVVVSLVPAPMHPPVARAAIQNKKHMVTASYVSPALAELNDAAKAVGVVIVNEAGLDPGQCVACACSAVLALPAAPCQRVPCGHV